MNRVTLSEFTAGDNKNYQVLFNGSPLMAATTNKKEACKVWEETFAKIDTACALSVFNGDTGAAEDWDKK